MYSGTTLNQTSGNFLGVHQKINKLAYKAFRGEVGIKDFPALPKIQHFEGKNGPDGLKRKRPSFDEPWHFIDPKNPKETDLLKFIRDHQTNLVAALKTKNTERAAFEAAWLAHAIVDGLTPAHHYPLEEKLEQLRGESIETRDSVRKKLVISADTRRERLKKNWEFWGARGVMTSHLLFELGVAGAITPMRNIKVSLTNHDVSDLKERGFEMLFLDHLLQIDRLGMYEVFCRKGWTPLLARETRRDLIPIIAQTVALAWLEASFEADL